MAWAACLRRGLVASGCAAGLSSISLRLRNCTSFLLESLGRDSKAGFTANAFVARAGRDSGSGAFFGRSTTLLDRLDRLESLWRSL